MSFEYVFRDNDYRFNQFCGAIPKPALADRPHPGQGASRIQPEKKKLFLRFAYVLLLTAFIAFAWIFTARIGGSTSLVYQISRMPETGKYVTTTIIWFQFIIIQLIAIVMLSTAISDEIYNRTLGLLMTTPISSLQIVIGKLFSKLLQLVLLLAISLPLLAIIRVMGGVPWDYVVSSLCIT